MSRTKIYMRMKDTPMILIGSNASYTDEIQNLDNGASLLKAASMFGETIPDEMLFHPEWTDLDIDTLLGEDKPMIFTCDVNNVNSNDISDTSLFVNDYSLDKIICDTSATDFSGSETSVSPYIGSPVPSPLSPSLDINLDDILNSKLVMTTPSFQEFSTECESVTEGNSNNLLIADKQLGSPDSGISSSDELGVDASELILQLLAKTENVRNTSGDMVKSEPLEADFTEDPLCEILRKLSEPSSPNNNDEESDSKRATPHRAHPYKRKVRTEEQKQRKKAQNRNAASRYRIKKKDELKVMLDEEEELREKNKNLKGKVENLRKEVDYLKTLMLDVIKARLGKGQKNPTLSLECLLQSNVIQS